MQQENELDLISHTHTRAHAHVGNTAKHNGYVTTPAKGEGENHVLHTHQLCSHVCVNTKHPQYGVGLRRPAISHHEAGLQRSAAVWGRVSGSLKGEVGV